MEIECQISIFDIKQESKTRTVEEEIKESDEIKKTKGNFIVSKNGYMAISRGNDIHFYRDKKEVLSMEVKRTFIKYGMYRDYTVIICR